MYNGTLTVYFLLTISYGWKLDRVKKREIWLHAIPLTLGWGTAIAVLPMDLYNAIGWTCWIGGSPAKTVNILRWAFFHAELWATFCFMAVALFLMHRSIKAKELASSKYSFRSSNSTSSSFRSSQGSAQTTQQRASRRSMNQTVSWSKRFAIQSWLYILAFFFAWIFPMVQWVISQSGGLLYYPILAITVVINPLQGFFNAVIYIRPRFMEYYRTKQREKLQKESQEGQPLILWQAITHACNVQDEPEDEQDEQPECGTRVSGDSDDVFDDEEHAGVQKTENA